MLEKLKAIGRGLRHELRVYQLVLKHDRTPALAKLLLWLAVGYLLLPFDLIPDWVPGLGQLDDLIVVPALILLARRMIPPEVVAECRLKVREPGKAATDSDEPLSPRQPGR